MNPPAVLGLAAFVVLWVLALALSAQTYSVLAGSRTDGDKARGELIAQAMAQRVSHAIAVGIPLDRLVGVPELLRQRLAAYPDVESIAVTDGANQVLWTASAPRDRLLQSRLPLLALPDLNVEAAIQTTMGRVGTVRLVVRGPDLVSFMASVALPLTLGCLFFAAMAWFAARTSFATSHAAREHALRLSIRDIHAARYDRLTLPLHRRGFDLRAQQLARAVRTAHEMLARVRRVVGSLRRTEPQPARRKWLDQVLVDAESQGRFAASSLSLRRVIASDAQAAWVTLMLSTAGGAVIAFAGTSAHASLAATGIAGSHALLLALAWAAAAAGWWAARRARVSAWLAIGAAALALTLAPWADRVMPGPAVLAVVIVAGLALGAALAASVTMQQSIRRRPDLRSSGTARPWASLAGWLMGLLCLGPAWAALLAALENDTIQRVAPAFPALMASCMTWRWNAVRSPWRTRMAQALAWPSAGRAGMAAALITGFIAATPVLDHGHLEMPFPWPSIGAALIAGVGLFVGFGVGGALVHRRRRLHWALAGGALMFLGGAVLELSDFAPGRGDSGAALAGTGPIALLAWGLQTIALGLLGFALACVVRGLHAAASERVRRGAGPIALALLAAAGALLLAAATLVQPWSLQWTQRDATAPVAAARDSGKASSPKDNRGT